MILINFYFYFLIIYFFKRHIACLVTWVMKLKRLGTTDRTSPNQRLSTQPALQGILFESIPFALQAQRWIISIKGLLNYVKNTPTCLSVSFIQPRNKTKIKEKFETFSRLRMLTGQIRLNNKLIYNKLFH